MYVANKIGFTNKTIDPTPIPKRPEKTAPLSHKDTNASQDRIAMYIMLMFAFIVFPFIANDYWLGSILIPFLALSLAALGLNVLTGYAGQISLGTAAFMAFELAPL